MSIPSYGEQNEWSRQRSLLSSASPVASSSRVSLPPRESVLPPPRLSVACVCPSAVCLSPCRSAAVVASPPSPSALCLRVSLHPLFVACCLPFSLLAPFPFSSSPPCAVRRQHRPPHLSECHRRASQLPTAKYQYSRPCKNMLEAAPKDQLAARPIVRQLP